MTYPEGQSSYEKKRGAEAGRSLTALQSTKQSQGEKSCAGSQDQEKAAHAIPTQQSHYRISIWVFAQAEYFLEKKVKYIHKENKTEKEKVAQIRLFHSENKKIFFLFFPFCLQHGVMERVWAVESDGSQYESQIYHVLAVWSWARQSLFLSFFI